MPFEVLETVTRSANPHGRTLASIQYKRRRYHKAKGLSEPKLCVGIPEVIIAQLPEKNLLQTVDGNALGNTKCGFVFMLGTGDDQGKARICVHRNGNAAVVIKKGVYFNFGFLPYLGDEAAEKTFVKCTALADGFEIELPAWFKPPDPDQAGNGALKEGDAERPFDGTARAISPTETS